MKATGFYVNLSKYHLMCVYLNNGPFNEYRFTKSLS